ncbi:MAG: DeoR family transcriptional regulator [Patescibacteria group bacterium]|nr:winged helix-turn-helix transcriptional regulator [Patescibacteria group bacterium]
MNNVKIKIIEYIKKHGRVSVNQLSNNFDLSRQMIHRHLIDLIHKGIIDKIGTPPKVFYFIKKEKVAENEIDIDNKTKETIEKNYLIITSSGERKSGVEGFIYWCDKNKLPIEKTAQKYVETLKKYKKFKKNELINGTVKIKSTFKEVALKYLFYLDFYSIERFGKTKLGQLLLYAKQSQNKKLMKELIDVIRPQVVQIIIKYKIDGIGFIPPTVKRETQFMKILENYLKLQVKTLKISKIKTGIVVPQKTLNKLDDRIDNAKKTIVVEDCFQYNNVLLIDDAVGSGATLNETAAQIKQNKIAKNVIGLAITGSFKGFDVISEV